MKLLQRIEQIPPHKPERSCHPRNFLVDVRIRNGTN